MSQKDKKEYSKGSAPAPGSTNASNENHKKHNETKTPHNIFYQKEESEPNMLNAPESDLDEVIQEVKPGSKAALLKKAQVQDSDDEGIITSNKPSLNSGKQQKSNNFVSTTTTNTSVHE